MNEQITSMDRYFKSLGLKTDCKGPEFKAALNGSARAALSALAEYLIKEDSVTPAVAQSLVSDRFPDLWKESGESLE
jgi:hypothetical protein